MNKSLLVYRNNQRKSKTRLALCIRVFGLVAITSFYLLASTLERSDTNEQPDQGESHRSRNLLGLNDSIIGDSINNNQSTEWPALDLTRSINSTNRSTTNVSSEHAVQTNCTQAAILELPSDGLTRAERQRGWIVIHLLLACYCFWLLATICDDYFVPAIETMCSSFNMNEDVVGATFMAAAASSPELFINSVGTFITKSDIGVGTVVGSAVFNVLAVPACCGLFAGQVFNLDWWPLSRDCLMYAISVISLICVLQDNRVMWYEALALVFAYLIYISVMYWNDIMARKARTMVAKLRRQSRVRPYRERSEITPLLATSAKSHPEIRATTAMSNGFHGPKTNGINGTAIQIQNHLHPIEEDFIELADSPWCKPHDTTLFAFILRWPITFLLWFTLPDCRKHPRLKMLTFFLCILWIGLTSYAVAMLITIVGDTANIPDSVMGLTFLAAGTSVPEAVSSVIVTNQGHGAMGISSSISSNTFDILLCLGLPWFVKAYFYPAVDGNYWIQFHSTGLEYSAICLLSTLCGLYLAFAINRFRLDWKIGLTCIVMYIAFLIFASLVELNVFFPVNLPICDH